MITTPQEIKYLYPALQISEALSPLLENAAPIWIDLNKLISIGMQEYQLRNPFNNPDVMYEWHVLNHDFFSMLKGHEYLHIIDKKDSEKIIERFNRENPPQNEAFDVKEDIGFIPSRIQSMPPQHQLDRYMHISKDKGNIAHIEPGELHVSQLGLFNNLETVKKLIIKIDNRFYQGNLALTQHAMNFFKDIVKKSIQDKRH